MGHVAFDSLGSFLGVQRAARAVGDGTTVVFYFYWRAVAQAFVGKQNRAIRHGVLIHSVACVEQHGSERKNAGCYCPRNQFFHRFVRFVRYYYDG